MSNSPQDHLVSSPSQRYHYLVLQASIPSLEAKLQAKLHSINQSTLSFFELDVNDSDEVSEFLEVYDNIGLTSPDPYESLSSQEVTAYFGGKTLVVRYLNQLVGYCIYTVDPQSGLGVIAGIGILHKFRGLGIGTALLARTLEEFQKRDLSDVQTDVLTSNQVSLHFFQRLSFSSIDDFYL